jgi:uncharacterized protein (DUF952 family)
MIAFMNMLFHITEATTWQLAQTEGVYRATSLETEGFIHLSESSQVKGVAQRFYRNRTGLVLLEIDPAQLEAEVRFDEVPGHGTFPHLYGPLNLDAVIQVSPFQPGGEAQTVES